MKQIRENQYETFKNNCRIFVAYRPFQRISWQKGYRSQYSHCRQQPGNYLFIKITSFIRAPFVKPSSTSPQDLSI